MRLNRDKIKAIMKAKRITQRELSARTNIAETTLSRRISGDMESCTFKTVERLAKGLEVSPRSLVSYDTIPTANLGGK